jgi:hypothetical protein
MMMAGGLNIDNDIKNYSKQQDPRTPGEDAFSDGGPLTGDGNHQPMQLHFAFNQGGVSQTPGN